MSEPVFSFHQLYQRLTAEPQLTAWHISLLMAMLCEWEKQNCINPIQVNRKSLMQLSRIRSFMTYHKCVKQLHQTGLICYCPSYNPLTGSLLYIRVDQISSS